MHRLPRHEEMYRALVERDASYEGVFFACVKTTGIFCRPTCTARKPNVENVEFVASVSAALHEGYRPCKVCQPLSASVEEPAWMGKLLERLQSSAGERLRDEDLRGMGIDPVAARRRFQRAYGMTFHAFGRAWRMGAAMRSIAKGKSSMHTALQNGYESESGFREAFARLFGAPLAQARKGEISCLTATWYATPLGRMIGIASESGVMLLEFLERRALETEIAFLRRHMNGAITPGRNAHLDLLEEELAAYFRDGRHEFTVATDAPGTEFQRRLWEKLREIPAGETWSYQQLARAVGSEGGSRAAGRACGENRIAIVIPCHRVVRTDGTLGGYGGQLWRKERLLAHERADKSEASGLLFATSAVVG